jgi:hypothetical protein
MKNFRTVSLGALAAATLLAAGLSLASCAETDVVAKVAVTSFDAVVQKLGDKVSYSADDKSWLVTSPAGDKFLVALDFSRPNADGEAPDFELDFDAAPFLAAGLDVAKLPMADGLGYKLEMGRFMLHFDWGTAALKAASDGSKAPDAATAPAAGLVATFKQIIASYRDRIGYHEKLDHYGFALGDGNMVEWAKDMATNDKDLVFVLNPAPLIAAGLDPNKVEGWVFAKVEIKDANGKAQLVDKLLKPFNL